MSRPSPAALIAAGCALAAGSALAYLAVGYAVAARLSSPARRPPRETPRTPADKGLAFREVRLRSGDGLALRAWWVGDGDASRAAVLVHGWGGDGSDDFVLESAAVYGRAGFAVLVLDLRGHGGSEGTRVTLGYEEARDVRAAVSWLGERGFDGGSVVLHGWSMGGAAVLRAAAGAGVAAVVEESSFADLLPLLRERLPEESGLPAFFTPAILFAGEHLLGIKARAVRPAEDASRLHREGTPLMVVHSPDDAVVPFWHASRLAGAHPGATLWKVAGYEHVGAHAHPEYRERLLRFLSVAFGTPSGPSPGPPR